MEAGGGEEKSSGADGKAVKEGKRGRHSISKPRPPVVVVRHVSHHNIHLSWDLEEQRKGPQEQWLKFSVEEEDTKLHKYGLIYTGYAQQHVVEGLEPRTTYRFRLKVTDPSGESAYSTPVCVTTTSEPMSGDHLHRAVSRNDVDQVLTILKGRQVVVDTLNKLGFTALMVASQKGYTRLAQILVENGADVNRKNASGKDSLMIACYAGHLDIAKYLRSQGASWLSRDLGGCTAMHWAADGGHVDVIEWMVKDGCQIDPKDTGLEWTPLMRLCAITGKADVATTLLDAGADVNAKDKDGKTPLMVAALNNHEELVALLLERGADPDVKNEFGKGALEMARGMNRQSVVSIIEERKRQLNNVNVDSSASSATIV
ncbi:fibronectin type 3 and ankyrin repeat domains protein 1 isoform X1 [Podarcis raffonei]|uniref:fibronectin type 3 and ankyrin repeat domains protein 1 isoform X1 n=1 Tax=Podarcis raffonei TaxID=65483 RepID=UPI002329220A|nr:fibronectin type 3 and ankyrin repeat domains protein 1 isoform X1 [Podarcis raffonei]XP_053244897.1 fibronectin type 3 and ankyrin repeat domains protein 1 isoform X1 [Podarcis raffonei]